MALTGFHFIGGERRAANAAAFAATNPACGERLQPAFAEASGEEVDESLRLADGAFDALQSAPADRIAGLLDAIAAGLEAAGDSLLKRAHEETALPMARLEGERGRTVNQTRLFAAMVRRGDWVRARIDRGNPARTPLPKPDVRAMLVGIGPVVVFGASNFPLAISVAGTDTISAFAARCPVVVKAHPAHPGTCELIGGIITEAIAAADLPPGMFSLLQGAGHEAGLALVQHASTCAVAFTGSLRGGRALFDAAASRPHPIPVYAEMGSTNPVFILPSAASERADAIARGYIESVTLGVGQFCTNPGIVFAQEGPGFDAIVRATAAAASKTPPATMLHAGIYTAYEEGVRRIAQTRGVEQIAVSAEAPDAASLQAACSIFKADARVLSEFPGLSEEVFGPASIVFQCSDIGEMLRVARNLNGHLTATIHGSEQDLLDHAELIRILQRKAGRVVFNGFPTGIEVCTAMHHGGPYPASTHSHFTSIGQDSIYRFTRPVCFQNFPDAALPPELKDANERNISRVVDGIIEAETR